MSEHHTGHTRDTMTLPEARAYLGIGVNKMTRLIADGVLKPERDFLDRRIRVVKRADVERVAEQSVKNAA
jgi:hypothetical protein